MAAIEVGNQTWKLLGPLAASGANVEPQVSARPLTGGYVCGFRIEKLKSPTIYFEIGSRAQYNDSKCLVSGVACAARGKALLSLVENGKNDHFVVEAYQVSRNDSDADKEGCRNFADEDEFREFASAGVTALQKYVESRQSKQNMTPRVTKKREREDEVVPGDKYENLNQKVEAQDQTITELTKKVKKLEQENKELKSQLQASEQKYEDVRKQFYEQSGEVKTLRGLFATRPMGFPAEPTASTMPYPHWSQFVGQPISSGHHSDDSQSHHRDSHHSHHGKKSKIDSGSSSDSSSSSSSDDDSKRHEKKHRKKHHKH